jgi:hypothetical protein
MKGIHIYMGGIGIQQFFIILFVGLCVKFHLEMNAIDRSVIAEEKGRWKKLLWAVYGSLGFITVSEAGTILERNAKLTLETDPYYLPSSTIFLWRRRE